MYSLRNTIYCITYIIYIMYYNTWYINNHCTTYNVHAYLPEISISVSLLCEIWSWSISGNWQVVSENDVHFVRISSSYTEESRNSLYTLVCVVKINNKVINNAFNLYYISFWKIHIIFISMVEIYIIYI